MGRQLNSRLWTLGCTSRGPERWFAIVEFFTFFSRLKQTAFDHASTAKVPGAGV